MSIWGIEDNDKGSVEELMKRFLGKEFEVRFKEVEVEDVFCWVVYEN